MVLQRFPDSRMPGHSDCLRVPVEKICSNYYYEKDFFKNLFDNKRIPINQRVEVGVKILVIVTKGCEKVFLYHYISITPKLCKI